MSKPIVLIAEQLSPATISALGNGFEIRFTKGEQRAKLLADIVAAHAILVRSATYLDAEVIAKAKNLKIIARAGVGLDNVDIKAATDAGIMVINAPTSNIISAAELTVAHILNLARKIPQAHQSLQNGKWQRSQFLGTELYGKKIGIIGLGRIGTLVAKRLQAFDTEIFAYDPYISKHKAAQLNVTLTTLDKIFAQTDFITIHMPKTPETLGMLGKAAFEKMQKTACVINVARGGLIDESALYDALKFKKIAGAALDVYEQEPNTDSPLFALENVIVTPHLGASTVEAQEKAGVSVAKSVKLALAGEIVPDAVNIAGGMIAQDVKPYIYLAEKLGQMFTILAKTSPTQLNVVVSGEIAKYDVKILELSVLKGLFTNIVSTKVSYVNCSILAKQRGVNVSLTARESVDQYRNLLALETVLLDGTKVSVSATLAEKSQAQKLVEVNGYELEIPLSDHLLLLNYPDLPGVVGKIGHILGENFVNIANMQVSRKTEGSTALAVITVDNTISKNILDKLVSATGAHLAKIVDI